MSCQIWHVDETQCLVKYGMFMELNVLSNMACLWNSMSCQIWHVDGTQCLVKYGMLMKLNVLSNMAC